VPPQFTLCFLTRGEAVLLLHRRRSPNAGLWNGVGGKLMAGETPLAACLREVREETGFDLPSARFAGTLTWSGFEIEDGGLYLFVAEAPAGEPIPNGEGELRWWPRAEAFSSPLVVANLHIVLPQVLNGAPPQTYHFVYRHGQLISHVIASYVSHRHAA
jgi:8-oxo-dGTP diphosphatase